MFIVFDSQGECLHVRASHADSERGFGQVEVWEGGRSNSVERGTNGRAFWTKRLGGV